MTVTLTYDDTLGRVQLVATGLGTADEALIERSTDQITWTTVRGGAAVPVAAYSQASDSYTRTVAAGSWGTATTGQVWATLLGLASQLSVNGTKGIISLEIVNQTRAARLPVAHTDLDVLVDMLIPAVPATSSIRGIIFGRYVDANNSYNARVDVTTASAVTVNLRKLVAGVESDVTGGATVTVAGLTASTTVPLRIRYQIRGQTLRIRVWLSNTAEPTVWHLAGVDTNFASGTSIGLGGILLAGNTNTLPIAQAFDNLVISSQYEARLDDYEFAPDVVNYYRVRGVTTSDITLVGSGAGSFSANAVPPGAVGPGLPAGMAVGDLMVMNAAIRNSGTGTVLAPTGWTELIAFGNHSLFGKYFAATDTAPTVHFAGEVANATIGAKIHAFRDAALTPVTHIEQLNGSAQNIAYPALTVPADEMLILLATWKQDAWTSIAAPAVWTEIGDSPSTSGDDESLGMDYQIQTTATNVAASSVTVTGGISAISRAIVAALEHSAYLNEQTGTITPSLAATCGVNAVWLKSIGRPFLNRTVQVMQRPDTTVDRPARAGIFDVVGRSFPIAVNTVRSSRRWTMYLQTVSDAEAEAVDLMLASGDVLLVQAPAGCDVETGYVSVGDVTNTRHPLRPQKRLWALPMTEVAPPGPDVTPSPGTWATVLATYATWADVLAANATWADLLTLVGSPSEVIVP